MLVPLNWTSNFRLYVLNPSLHLVVTNLDSSIELIIVGISLPEFSFLPVETWVIALRFYLSAFRFEKLDKSVYHVLVLLFDLKLLHKGDKAVSFFIQRLFLFFVLRIRKRLNKSLVEFIFHMRFHIFNGVIMFCFVLEIQELLGFINGHFKVFIGVKVG